MPAFHLAKHLSGEGKMPEIIKHQEQSVYKLYSGRWARISFYNALQKHISGRINQFETRGKFTLRQLCGDEYWSSIESVHLRRIAGMCFRTMVGERVFPLVLKRFKKSPTRYYEFTK